MRIMVLDSETADPFRQMTFPAYRRLLEFDPGLPTAFALGAWAGAAPAGLALNAVDRTQRRAQLLSLYIDPGMRGLGYAGRLLGAAGQALAREGMGEVFATYMTGSASTAALEAVFRKCGWDEPATRMLVIRCSLDSIARAPWIKRYRLPAGWSIVPWLEISEAERAAIRDSQQTSAWIPPDLVPFQYEQNIEPVTSLALRVRRRVLGWTLNHVVEGMLRYTCSYVHPDLQRLGRILLLYNEAVARMPAAGLSVGTWTVPLHHAGMVRFARRWMQPHSIFFGETRGTMKRLAAGAGT